MNKSTFYIALFVAFIDHMGVGLVYPLFSSMLFDTELALLPQMASHAERGLWLGILIALMPLAQFFTAPVWGALSDAQGRKTPLLKSLSVGLLGYLVAWTGVVFTSLPLLIASRFLNGCSAGNVAIVQATIADLSTHESKAKNYGLYGMALGTGFTVGPFLGGFLSKWSYSTPFLFAGLLVAFNLIITPFIFRETHHLRKPHKILWHAALIQLKKAFRFYGIRTILLASFLHNFAWSFFFEFVPVYFIQKWKFSPAQLGLFYGLAGAFYAVSTGLLIRPFVARLNAVLLFFGGNLLTAFGVFMIPLLPEPDLLWPLLFFICFFVAFVTPTSTTLISNSAPSGIQGEALGVLTSVNAAALMLSPLLSGSLVGAYSSLALWVGGGVLLITALIVLAVFRGRLFKN